MYLVDGEGHSLTPVQDTYLAAFAMLQSGLALSRVCDLSWCLGGSDKRYGNILYTECVSFLYSF